MKIATITWITYNNYGTALQAYGLQRYLLDNGAENFIISDQFIVTKEIDNEGEAPIQTHSNTILNKIFYYGRHPMRLCFVLKNIVVMYVRRYLRRPYIKSQRMFEDFKRDELQLLYGFTKENVAELNKLFDVFVCGSDQIWSVLDRNFDGYFYLDFVTKKKVAYAASLGTTHIDEEKKAAIKRYLYDFSAIAVRERQSAEQLSGWMMRSVEWVVDPTLLHDGEFWRAFSADKKIIKKKYLLCYFLGRQEWYLTYARQLAGFLGLKLILLPVWPSSLEKRIAYRRGVGPKEFVALFRDAEFVLTDSYHGTIFALQFQKAFLHLRRFSDLDAECQNIRIYSLLSKLGLDQLILPRKDFEREDIHPINYLKVEEALSNFRMHSREYINSNILEQR